MNRIRIKIKVRMLQTIEGRPIIANQPSQLSSMPELATARGLIRASPVRKTSETGTEAAKTVNPILVASSFGIFALSMRTIITAMIRKARGQGCGMRRLSINVIIKIETMVLLKFLTNFNIIW